MSHNSVARWQDDSLAEVLSRDDADVSGRCTEWTESIAVGSQTYVTSVRNELGIYGRHREVRPAGGGDKNAYLLREAPAAYRCNNEAENGSLNRQNAPFWQLTS